MRGRPRREGEHLRMRGRRRRRAGVRGGVRGGGPVADDRNSRGHVGRERGARRGRGGRKGRGREGGRGCLDQKEGGVPRNSKRRGGRSKGWSFLLVAGCSTSRDEGKERSNVAGKVYRREGEGWREREGSRSETLSSAQLSQPANPSTSASPGRLPQPRFDDLSHFVFSKLGRLNSKNSLGASSLIIPIRLIEGDSISPASSSKPNSTKRTNETRRSTLPFFGCCFPSPASRAPRKAQAPSFSVHVLWTVV